MQPHDLRESAMTGLDFKAGGEGLSGLPHLGCGHCSGCCRRGCIATLPLAPCHELLCLLHGIAHQVCAMLMRMS